MMIKFEDVKEVSCNEYFGGEQFSCDMFSNKYAFDGEDGAKETPAEVFYRVATGLLGNTKERDICFSLMYNGWFRPGGSVLRGVGGQTQSSLANCSTVPLEGDSLEDISRCDFRVMKCAAYRQGIGIDFSKLRPAGTQINNAAQKSLGVLPWINKIVDNGKYVGQLGRMPALLVSLKDNHPDIFEFVTSKVNKGAIENANISVQVSDNFMEAVKQDKDWELKFEFEGNEYPDVVTTVKAKELFDLIAKTAYKSAEPGVQYVDQLRQGMMVHQIYEVTKDPRFMGISSNACQSEESVILTKNGIKKLGNINVGDIIWSGKKWTKVKRKWCTGVKDVYEYITSAGRFMGTSDHKIFQNKERIEVDNAKSIDICIGDNAGAVDFIPEIIMDGLIIGDGTVKYKNTKYNKILLCIGRNDYDYFDSEISHLILNNSSNKRKLYKIISSINIDELPITYLRKIPDRFYYGDHNTVCSFLKGLFSANGSINGDRVALKQSSFELTMQVVEMLSSVGIASYVSVNKAKKVKFANGEYNVKVSYDVNITTHRNIFYEKIGFIQKYKQDKLKALVINIKPRNWNKQSYDVIKKNYVGRLPVFDIEVESEKHCFWTGGVLVSNCSEKFLPPNSICNLSSINMENFSTTDYKKELKEIVPYLVRMADAVVDYELENDLSPIPEQKWILEQTREIGCGITNIHGWLMKQDLGYDSDEAIEKVEDFFKEYAYQVFKTSILLGKEKGSAPAYGMIEPGEYMRSTYFKNMVDGYYEGDPSKITHMRNLAHISIAPVGSLSNTFPKPCVSSGVEPMLAPYYWRKTRIQDRSKYQYYFIIPNRIREYVLSVLDKDSEAYKKLFDFPGSVLDDDGSIGGEFIGIIKNNVPKGMFKPSHEIDYNQKIKLLSRLYRWMDASISCTYNLPKTATVEDVKDIYMKTWEMGARAVSVYVEGSREGILLTEFPEEKQSALCSDSRPVDIVYNCAPKRPQVLPCNIHQISVKGEKWVVLVGVFNDKPFELFCGSLEDIYLPQKCQTGEIIKQGGSKYSLRVTIRNSDVTYRDIANLLMSDNEKALTRLISLNLRHGVYPQFIVDQLKKSNGGITAFSTAISRVLSKYVIDYVFKDNLCPKCGQASLSFEEGCIKCLDCDYSRCD